MNKQIFHQNSKQRGFIQHNSFKESGAGFTLIELLIVICIIGILTALIVLSLSDLRKRARDTRRKADLTQIRVALNLYYEDNKFEYPKCGYIDEEESDFGATADCFDITLGSALAAGARPYVGKLPEDPKNIYPYVYKYVSDGDKFIMAYEAESATEESPVVIRGW